MMKNPTRDEFRTVHDFRLALDAVLANLASLPWPGPDPTVRRNTPDAGGRIIWEPTAEEEQRQPAEQAVRWQTDLTRFAEWRVQPVEQIGRLEPRVSSQLAALVCGAFDQGAESWRYELLDALARVRGSLLDAVHSLPVAGTL